MTFWIGIENNSNKIESKNGREVDWGTIESRNGRNWWRSNGDGKCIRRGNMEWVMWVITTDKDIETISKGACDYVLWIQTRRSDEILRNKMIYIAIDTINIFLLCGWAIDDYTFIYQQFSTPPLQLVTTAIIF